MNTEGSLFAYLLQKLSSTRVVNVLFSFVQPCEKKSQNILRKHLIKVDYFSLNGILCWKKAEFAFHQQNTAWKVLCSAFTYQTSYSFAAHVFVRLIEKHPTLRKDKSRISDVALSLKASSYESPILPRICENTDILIAHDNYTVSKKTF